MPGKKKKKKMTKTQAKDRAKHEILNAMELAFMRIEDSMLSIQERKMVITALKIQIKRIEKLFR